MKSLYLFPFSAFLLLPFTVSATDTSTSSNYYGEVSVTVSGVKEKTNEAVPLVAEIFINGRYVGTTPFQDGLPRGEYLIRLEAGGNSQSWTQKVVPGRSHEIKGQLIVPLTAAEQAELSRIEAAESQRKLDAETTWYQQEIDNWKSENNKIKARRKPLVVTSLLLMGAGVGLTIAGVVALTTYQDQRSENNKSKSMFDKATDPVEIERQRDFMDRTGDHMQTNKTLAGIFLPVGLTSFVTSIVMLACLPKLKPMPGVPAHLKAFVKVSAGGFLMPGAGGLQLTGTF